MPAKRLLNTDSGVVVDGVAAAELEDIKERKDFAVVCSSSPLPVDDDNNVDVAAVDVVLVVLEMNFLSLRIMVVASVDEDSLSSVVVVGVENDEVIVVDGLVLAADDELVVASVATAAVVVRIASVAIRVVL